MALGGGNVPYRTISTSEFIKRFSNLAQSSQFRAVIQIGTLPFTKNFAPQTRYIDDLSILCSNASLPGSSFSTTENLQDYYGVNQTFAYRRDFDDLTLEFYVDTQYRTLKFFETWMDYISSPDESYSVVSTGGPKMRNSFYRFKYPKFYKCDLDVHKFNKDYDINRADILYSFVNAYPTSISSIPVSYDSSTIIKLSVTFKYDRYFVNRSSNAIQTGGEPKGPTNQATAAGNTFDPNSAVLSGLSEQGYATVSDPFGSSVTFFDGNDGQLDF